MYFKEYLFTFILLLSAVSLYIKSTVDSVVLAWTLGEQSDCLLLFFLPPLASLTSQALSVDLSLKGACQHSWVLKEKARRVIAAESLGCYVLPH